jgi:hypothetical protein
MENVKEFVDKLVKIDYLDNYNCFGHFPFQLFVVTSDGSFEINALALGGDVLSCYKRFRKYLKEDSKKIFMSLDFPSGGDIKNDFICIFSAVDGALDIYAIPYNTENGEKYEEIHTSELLSKILDQFKKELI